MPPRAPLGSAPVQPDTTTTSQPVTTATVPDGPPAAAAGCSGDPGAVRRQAAPAPPARAPRPEALLVDEPAPPLAAAAPPAAPGAAADPSSTPLEAPPHAAAAAPPPPHAAADDSARHLDVEALTANMTRLLEHGRRAFAAMAPRDGGAGAGAADLSDAVATLGRVAEHWYADPDRSLQMQARLGNSFLTLFASMTRRLAGEPAAPAATPDPHDTRFSDPEWSSNRYFDFVKQAYLILAEWGTWLVEHADTVDPAVRARAEFYMRQIVDAAAPSNFVVTSPVLLRTTLDRSAANLERGAQMLAEDLEAGGGGLKIRQSDPTSFAVGGNLAVTPGKVVHQNAVMQLIQYAPATPRVMRRPLLIVPPWINKYYVLDLTPETSFVRWCVEHGVTVFVISWVNPDQRHAGKDFADYMREGPLEALDVIADITGEDEVAAAGYCVGGTLLAFTLAFMAATGDRRIAAATLLAAQVDFTHAGDLKVFAATEAQVAAIEREMAVHGYLDAARMALAFNLLRPNQLIWPYVVDNYLRGEPPFAFDLLYWNADSTRVPAANHSYYLRNFYLHNNLAKGTLTAGDVAIDVSKIAIPLYSVAARDDHIAPAKSVYLGSSMFGGPVRLVVSGAGHIAGVVNPPQAHKYRYFTGAPPRGDDLDAWLARATAHEGSWWPDWMAWLKGQDGDEVPARVPGGGRHPPIEDAPGSYVKVRS